MLSLEIKLTYFPLGVKKADAGGDDEEEGDQCGVKKRIRVVMMHAGSSNSGGVKGVGRSVGSSVGSGVGSVDGLGGGNDREPNHKCSSGSQWEDNFKNVEEY